MTVTKKIRGRNVSGYLVVDASNLARPGGAINSWTRRLSNAISTATIGWAPTNKRPKWLHTADTTLKKSITTASHVVDAKNVSVSTAVGSRAPYALYVDQGTGPQMAKILPPWPGRGYAFFDAGWAPKGGTPRGPKPVNGQKAQEFFDAGVRDGMRAMGLIAAPRPGDGGAFSPRMQAMANAEFDAPDNSAAFKLQLALWRAGREEAWLDPQAAFARNRARERKTGRRKGVVKPKPPRKPKTATTGGFSAFRGSDKDPAKRRTVPVKTSLTEKQKQDRRATAEAARNKAKEKQMRDREAAEREATRKRIEKRRQAERDAAIKEQNMANREAAFAYYQMLVDSEIDGLYFGQQQGEDGYVKWLVRYLGEDGQYHWVEWYGE